MLLFYPSMSPERRRMLHALTVPFLLSLLMTLVFVLGRGMNWDLSGWGVLPHTVSGLKGILLHPLVHASFSHLLNNLITFFILCTALYYFYRPVASKVVALLWISTGVLLWLIGRESYHVGASGVIYGLAFFIFWSGLFSGSIAQMALSLAVVFWYGSMVWDMFPFLPNQAISWEGHLSGGVSGSVLAFILRKEIRVKQPPENEHDDLPNDDLTEQALQYDKEAEHPRDEESTHSLPTVRSNYNSPFCSK